MFLYHYIALKLFYTLLYNSWQSQILSQSQCLGYSKIVDHFSALGLNAERYLVPYLYRHFSLSASLLLRNKCRNKNKQFKTFQEDTKHKSFTNSSFSEVLFLVSQKLEISKSVKSFCQSRLINCFLRDETFNQLIFQLTKRNPDKLLTARALISDI